MKLSIRHITDYKLQCKDGFEGAVKDFLFDQETWKIRYLEADLGSIFKDRKLLVPIENVNKINLKDMAISLNLTKAELEACPPLDKNLPISRKYEQELHDHFQMVPYWNHSSAPSVAIPAEAFPPRPISTPDIHLDESDLGTNLRSFNEIRDYHIKATDGEIGHVKDAIMDELDRQIVYLVVDTSNWLPFSKKVLISINWMKEVSYSEQHVSINLDKEAIRDAPEFDPSLPVNTVYEKKLYNFYGTPVD